MSTATVDRRRGLLRSRWAAIGAAVAVTLGAGGLFTAHAANDATSGFVAIAPARALDTRGATNVGLTGPFTAGASRNLQITGPISVVTSADPFATGTQTVVPIGATAVVLNVTAIRPDAPGYVSVRPGNATGTPTTSSLNVVTGRAEPNGVTVALPAAGDISIFYGSAPGATTNLAIDIVGFYTSTNFQEQIDTLDGRADDLEGQVGALGTRVDALEGPAPGGGIVTMSQTFPGAAMIAGDGGSVTYDRSCMFNNRTSLSYLPVDLPVGATITGVDVTVKLQGTRTTPESYLANLALEERTGQSTNWVNLATGRHNYPDEVPTTGRVVKLTPSNAPVVKANRAHMISLSVVSFNSLDANSRPGICNATITYTMPT